MRTWRSISRCCWKKGLDGLREKVAERRSRINLTVLEDLHGEQFLKAIDIVLVAVSEHIERFAAPGA